MGQGVVMFKPSARVGKTMRNAGAFILVLLASISFSAVSSGHEPKEFTVLLTDQGINPANIPEGTLVETDYLFLYNVDKREGVKHRVQIDSEGDGSFDGPDDLASAWLSGFCEKDENGTNMDKSCMITEFVLLGPENGLLPGNISLRHQIMDDGLTNSTDFSLVLGRDVHQDFVPEISQKPTTDDPEGNENDLPVVILFCSIMGVLAILPSFLNSNSD